MSNNLDPDQVCQYVWPDLGPNRLPKLSADDTGIQRVFTHAKLHLQIQLEKSISNAY